MCFVSRPHYSIAQMEGYKLPSSLFNSSSILWSGMERELPIPSELCGLANFLMVDIFMLSYIMYISGILAGYVNDRCVRERMSLQLVTFNVPVIGGGIVMNRGPCRRIFIALRLSVVIAVAACNFGLEGRSVQAFDERKAMVRGPGRMSDKSIESVHNATERNLRCGNAVGDDIVFGSVVDGQCYLNIHSHVTIRNLTMNRVRLWESAKNCTRHERCGIHTMVYRCEAADIVCAASPLCFDSGSEGVGRCGSVSYEEGYAWICEYNALTPDGVPTPVNCRGIAARREDISGWVDLYNVGTDDVVVAVFGSAYGMSKAVEVRIPNGVKVVTIVNLWWVIPVSWVLAVFLLLTVWSMALSWRGGRVIAHDEAGLLCIIEKYVPDTCDMPYE